MIYFIGGPPKCGKTTLAKSLSKKLGIPWISGDTLGVIAREYMDEKDIPSRFPWSAIRQGSMRDNDAAYAQYSAEQIVGMYTIQANATAGAIDMLSICEIKDGNDYIVEGYQVEPELVNNLMGKYGKENFRALFLIRKDVEKFVRDCKKSTTPNDWILTNTKNEETYERIGTMVSEYGTYFQKEAEKYGFDVLNMDENFEEQIQKAVKLLLLE